MIFRTTIFIALALALMSLFLFSSCESHEQTADDAFELVKQEKKAGTYDTISIVNDTISSVSKPQVVKETPVISKVVIVQKKAENLDEWTVFKLEVEKKILNNESKIKVVKSNSSSNSKLLKKLITLEKENNDLRRQMNEYAEEMKIKMETFKANLNQNVSNIDLEIKDLVIAK